MRASRLSGLMTTLALLAVLGLAPTPASAVVVLTGCAGGAFGDDCSLGELATGGSILIDDKLFDAWGFSLVTTTDADDILVTPTGEGTSTLGVRYTAFGTAWEASGPEIILDELFYSVSVVSGPDIIVGAEQEMAPAFLSGIDPFVDIVTNVDFLDFIFTFDSLTFGTDLFDDSGAPFHISLDIVTSITVAAEIPGDIAELDFFETRFLQNRLPENQVPEPGTLALLGLALGGLGMRRRC